MLRTNVLFIAVDDLNDWIGCLGGHPQTKTPNFDRLAASGVLFKNACCPAASCNPSRTAILSGIAPHRSELYTNRQKLREVMPEAELLPKCFSRNGYWSAGFGKILHYNIEPQSWNEYFPEKAKDNPFPRNFEPEPRSVNLPRSFVARSLTGLTARRGHASRSSRELRCQHGALALHSLQMRRRGTLRHRDRSV